MGRNIHDAETQARSPLRWSEPNGRVIFHKKRQPRGTSTTCKAAPGVRPGLNSELSMPVKVPLSEAVPRSAQVALSLHRLSMKSANLHFRISCEAESYPPGTKLSASSKRKLLSALVLPEVRLSLWPMHLPPSLRGQKMYLALGAIGA